MNDAFPGHVSLAFALLFRRSQTRSHSLLPRDFAKRGKEKEGGERIRIASNGNNAAATLQIPCEQGRHVLRSKSVAATTENDLFSLVDPLSS